MQFTEKQTRLMFDNSKLERHKLKHEHKTLYQKLEKHLEPYKNKNLLVIDQISSGYGKLKPLIFFGEYDSIGSFSSYGRGPDLYFKKPLLYADIKLQKKNLEKSSIRYRWENIFDSHFSPFYGSDDFKIRIMCGRHLGIFYENETLLSVDLDKSWNFGDEFGRNEKTIWDVTREIFQRKFDNGVESKTLYKFFEQKYLSSTSQS